MSTTTIDMHDSLGVETDTHAAPRKGLVDRVIELRMRQGKAHVAGYLMRQSDATLAGLGFNAEQIAAIRKTGEIPHSFWR